MKADKRWLKEAATLTPFLRHGAAIIAHVNGPEAALEYVREARRLVDRASAEVDKARGMLAQIEAAHAPRAERET